MTCHKQQKLCKALKHFFKMNNVKTIIFKLFKQMVMNWCCIHDVKSKLDLANLSHWTLKRQKVFDITYNKWVPQNVWITLIKTAHLSIKPPEITTWRECEAKCYRSFPSNSILFQQLGSQVVILSLNRSHVESRTKYRDGEWQKIH